MEQRVGPEVLITCPVDTGAGRSVWAQLDLGQKGKPLGGDLRGVRSHHHSCLKLEWAVQGDSEFPIKGGMRVLAGDLLGGPWREDTREGWTGWPSGALLSIRSSSKPLTAAWPLHSVWDIEILSEVSLSPWPRHSWASGWAETVTQAQSYLYNKMLSIHQIQMDLNSWRSHSP